MTNAPQHRDVAVRQFVEVNHPHSDFDFRTLKVNDDPYRAIALYSAG